MLVLSKFDNVRNVCVNTKPESKEVQDLNASTVIVTLKPWTLNHLQGDKETAFDLATRTSKQVKDWMREGKLRVLVVGNGGVGTDGTEAIAEAEAEVVKVDKEIASLDKALRTAKGASKTKLMGEIDEAKTRKEVAVAKLDGEKAKGGKPAGFGDFLPRSLENVDTHIATELVEGIVDPSTLKGYLRGEKRKEVIDAIQAQASRVKDMHDKAKDLSDED